MTLNLVKPEQIVSSSYARWLIFGPNGAGKSTLAATFPRPMMVLSADGENMAPYAGLDGVLVNLISDWDQIHETYQMLKTDGGKSIKTVVVDTLTRIMWLYMDKITGVKNVGVDNGERLKAGRTKQKIDWDDWRDLGSMSVYTVRDFNHLPMHLLYLAQEETVESKFEAGILATVPVLSKSGWKGVKDIVHMVGRLYVTEAAGGLATVAIDGNRSINPQRQEQRNLLIGQHDRYFSKGPVHRLGYCVENPCWDNLSKAL